MVEDEAEPVTMKLGVWISNTKSRRDKLAQEQVDALRELSVAWAENTLMALHRSRARPSRRSRSSASGQRQQVVNPDAV